MTVVSGNNLDGELLTAEEVAVRLRIKPNTLLGWVRQGRVPCVRFTRRVIRFRMVDVLSCLESASR